MGESISKLPELDIDAKEHLIELIADIEEYQSIETGEGSYLEIVRVPEGDQSLFTFSNTSVEGSGDNATGRLDILGTILIDFGKPADAIIDLDNPEEFVQILTNQKDDENE